MEEIVARLASAASLLVFYALCAVAQPVVWDGLTVPITIEVTSDVPVRSSERRPDGSFGQERGSLYSSQSFQIATGERFRMIEMLREGECRIEFQGSVYLLSSCPWMPGFTDHQTDIFRIVEVGDVRPKATLLSNRLKAV